MAQLVVRYIRIVQVTGSTLGILRPSPLKFERLTRLLHDLTDLLKIHKETLCFASIMKKKRCRAFFI